MSIDANRVIRPAMVVVSSNHDINTAPRPTNRDPRMVFLLLHQRYTCTVKLTRGSLNPRSGSISSTWRMIDDLGESLCNPRSRSSPLWVVQEHDLLNARYITHMSWDLGSPRVPQNSSDVAFGWWLSYFQRHRQSLLREVDLYGWKVQCLTPTDVVTSQAPRPSKGNSIFVLGDVIVILSHRAHVWG